MRPLVVVEGEPAADGVLPGAGLAEGSGVEALFVQGVVRALHFAVLLGHSHRDELVVDSVGLEGLLKGVGLPHVGEEDIGELHAVVGLDLLDGEGEGAKDMAQEKPAGLKGELRADPGQLESGAIVDGGVEVLLKGLGALPET